MQPVYWKEDRWDELCMVLDLPKQSSFALVLSRLKKFKQQHVDTSYKIAELERRIEDGQKQLDGEHQRNDYLNKQLIEQDAQIRNATALRGEILSACGADGEKDDPLQAVWKVLQDRDFMVRRCNMLLSRLPCDPSDEQPEQTEARYVVKKICEPYYLSEGLGWALQLKFAGRFSKQDARELVRISKGTWKALKLVKKK